METPLIELKNITFKYSSEETKNALSNVSLNIYPGEWVALIGHNGSGKSTLAKTINGLIMPNEGEIFVKGEKVTEKTLWDVRKMIGMVFQNPDNQFVGSTVEDDVAFGLENQGVPREDMVNRVKDALEKVRMSDFAVKEPARLSGGQKQRVAIAGVIALRPDVIILDEATSMLDPQGRQEVIETIRKIKEDSNLTVISITHDIDEAAHANRVLVMREGEIIQEGTPATIFSRGEELIELGLDVPFPEKLKAALNERGIDVPATYLTEEGMVDWLWTSGLNK
ncbi:energy-coupling factor ABC transporter ATP-binding protein [Vagococcus carniphilus]|uniref:Energy-coupling factor ABC transporter ATP-binding protein n=1 Tax=Vagococcus carniphilus TaxID=218144 RepID=A0A430ARY7_9ENTE|nr:energy-coupling factor ABC transporter ATP-binding protein [Vagococcus carniphilus]MDT2830289.1 energy-coupling factor ABC transporter ATP-binding protein [Vagococcus carniphilus]MDT2834347.1 energy-coupling factor ABC transporter ATP-binding protein [Vagococcus carniphilus]MDT2838721.1 energy-coupling factor ABC transporter ATP-binding protein [Vagococcus carniphilus]MDT2848294.1 energy-coupling factor ABC transporter ATP-binding protein [Vagococcus carniphilus]MDT2853559.1 energy-coupling